MKKTLHFLSGLPGSGSTVLAAILNQHPMLHTTVNSGLLDLLTGTVNVWATKNQNTPQPVPQSQQDDIQRILTSIAESKYEYTNKPIILDKSIGWASENTLRMMANVLGYKPKIVVAVRTIPDCVASFVKIANPPDVSNFLFSTEVVNYIKESYQLISTGYSFAPECFLFVEYDNLLANPVSELNRIHEFLGLYNFTYDLNLIDGTNFKDQDDKTLNINGLHSIGPKLERQYTDTAEEILGVYYSQYRQPKFWCNEPPDQQPIHDLDLQLAEGLLGNFNEGYKLALKLEENEPWNNRAAFNRGWYKIWKGEFLEGETLLYRGRQEGVFGNKIPNVKTPMWNGVSKGTVMLNLEGGLGDQFHGFRYAKYIIERGCKVIIACSSSIAGIFKDIEGVSAVIHHDAINSVVHDFWAPSMSTAMILGLDSTDLSGKPYITAPTVNKSKKFRIGLRWQGNPQFEHEQHRKFPSKLMFDAVKDNDVEFISLQRDDGAEHTPYWVNKVPLDYWEQTAAAIATCDLVITSCTSVAHLSAAMGINTWIIVPILPYYLWAKPGDNTYWYDSVRLFRQTTFGNWQPIFAKLQLELKNLLKEENICQQLNQDIGSEYKMVM